MAGKKVRKGREDSKVFIGKYKNPIAIIRRGDIEGYVDDKFLSYFQCWKRLHAGMGLPYGEGWQQYPDMFTSILEIFESEWRNLNNAHIH